MDEHPEELVVQAEDEHQVEEGKEPVTVLEEQSVQDVEVDEIDDEWRLQQVPYHKERCLGSFCVAGAKVCCNTGLVAMSESLLCSSPFSPISLIRDPCGGLIPAR